VAEKKQRSAADEELIELQRQVLSSPGVGVPRGVDEDGIVRWQERRAAQREAYGQFVAADSIYIGNALAFAPGMAVPVEHVERFNLEATGQVERVATPELARAGRRSDSEKSAKGTPDAGRVDAAKADQARGETPSKSTGNKS
jgi:hypothetical protein